MGIGCDSLNLENWFFNIFFEVLISRKMPLSLEMRLSTSKTKQTLELFETPTNPYITMKKLFSLLLLSSLVLTVFAQEEEDMWLNRTNYINTDNCIDSVTCYTIVVVDINKAVVMDSMNFQFNIGTQYGASDIFGRNLVYTPAIYQEEDVTDNGSYFTVKLGEFIITEEFFVDVQLTE
jgi:hypothetical protein